MANVFDLSALAAELRADVQAVIQGEVIEVCRLALERAVRETVYAGGNGGFMYARTMEFLSAVDVMDVQVGGSRATFRVTVNPGKMNLYSATQNEWGKHEGLSGQDFRAGLVEVLDQGGGSLLYSHPAHGFFDRAYQDIDSQILSIMGGALAARGWTVTY